MQQFVGKSRLFLMFLMLFSCSALLQASEEDPLLQKSSLTSFEKFISKEEIHEKLKEIAAKIDSDMQGEKLTVVMLMKGAFIVTADLVRYLQTPCILEFIQTSSYGAKGKVRGELTIHGLDKIDIAGKNVLVVDDVFDSGVTLSTVVDKINAFNPLSVRSLVLLSKNIPHKVAYTPDYVLFDIEDRFVVGYGMDYKEHWRELPDVYAVR